MNNSSALKNDNTIEEEISIVSITDYLEYAANTDLPTLNVEDWIDSTNQSSYSRVNNCDNQETIRNFRILDLNIANNIEKELSKWWSSKNTILNNINSINKYNVYRFVKNMLTVSKSRTVLNDIRKYLTYAELKHIIYSLLKAAEMAELSGCIQYKMLKKEYFQILNICYKNSHKHLDKKRTEDVNILIENIFEEICKVEFKINN